MTKEDRHGDRGTPPRGTPSYPGGGTGDRPGAREGSGVVPDALGPLTAYRVWSVRVPCLYPTTLMQMGPWRGEPARCANTVTPIVEGHDEPSPAKRCHCGYYAGKEPMWNTGPALPRWAQRGPTDDDWMRGIFASHLVGLRTAAGRVKIWGVVYEYERGYRAQFAKPTGLWRLWAPEFEWQAEVVAKRYGVPILDPPEGMRGEVAVWMRKHQEAERREKPRPGPSPHATSSPAAAFWRAMLRGGKKA